VAVAIAPLRTPITTSVSEARARHGSDPEPGDDPEVDGGSRQSEP